MDKIYSDDLAVPVEDVTRIVKLLGEIAGMQSDLTERKQALLEGLAELVEADGWLWSATQVIHEENRPYSVGVMYGGLSEYEFAGWLEASQTVKHRAPEDEPLSYILREGKHFTRTRQQVVPDDVWYNHPTVKKFRLERGVDHFMHSIYPLGPSHCSAIGFFRRVDREPFNDMQRRICHIVVSNIKWMHELSFPEYKGEVCDHLSPRQRTILVYLLDGKKREEIANILYISPNTAKTHISNIYKHFNVSSQTELMKYFQYGNGRDL